MTGDSQTGESAQPSITVWKSSTATLNEWRWKCSCGYSGGCSDHLSAQLRGQHHIEMKHHSGGGES